MWSHSSHRSAERRSPRACRPRTSISTSRTRRPQPRRRCRRQPEPTSQAHWSSPRRIHTRARGRGHLMWSHLSHRSSDRRSPRACRPRTSIPSSRSRPPQPRRRCRRQAGSTSRRSQSTRAHDQRHHCRCCRLSWRRWPCASHPRTSIPYSRTCRPQPRRRCRRQPGSTRTPGAIGVRVHTGWRCTQLCR